MPAFRYRAVDESGALVRGVLVADTPADARMRIRRMRCFPESVEPTGGTRAGLLDLLPGSRARCAQAVTLFTRQCGILLTSGVPLVEALDVLARQAEQRRFAETLLEIREAVNAGSSFADALAAYPLYFDRSFIETAAAAEKSGTLDAAMMRLADFLERRQALRARLSTALIYPAILLVMTVGLLLFLSAVLVPMLAPLLRQHQGALPLTTVILLAVCNGVRRWIAVVLLVPVVVALALLAVRRTPRGRLFLDRLVLRIPLAGGMIVKSYISRVSMSLATLLRTGVPALEALETISGVTPNAAYAQELGRIREAVLEGRDISAEMERSRIFPPMMAVMVAVGERSGNLAEVLEHVSRACDLELEIASRRLLAILEPVLVLVMAGVVGFIAMSLMTTIMELSRI